MAWEKRGGSRYYYRKRRLNGRVISEYVGNGVVAEAMALLDQAERLERATEIEIWLNEKKRVHALAQQARDFEELVSALIGAAYLLTDHHQHKRGEWRRRRD